MPTVFFRLQNKNIAVLSGTTVLEAARSAGIFIESPCGGVGTCGKCKVHLVKNKDGKEFRNIVLACRQKVENDLIVETIGREQNDTMKILNGGEGFKAAVYPYITKKYDSVKDNTAVFFGKEKAGLELKDTEGFIFGASVDIGTTTLVVSIIDLASGEVLSEESSLNPQAVFAQDVLSRISFAKEENGLERLFNEITTKINELILTAAQKAGIDAGNIYEVVYSGNTCMIHLAVNVSPASLGAYPYTPQIRGGSTVPADELGLAVSKFGRVYLPPIISAYVGADITSGVLASQLYKKSGTTLFVDIGTNGEMVIARDGKLFATSTAAGPAFEGMNIACGMRAANGAVEQFDINDSGEILIKTIGNAPTEGICGSGLIDIAGELVANNVITSNGRFTKDASSLPESLSSRLVPFESKTAFKVSDGVFLTQKDVRQIQLAKGAVRAGVEYLLKSVGVDAQTVDEVLIAGSFGYHLRARSLMNIGLLPAEFEGKIRFIGNTSRTGGEAFLLDSRLREKMQRVADDVNVVELANCKDFDRLFVSCLGF